MGQEMPGWVEELEKTLYPMAERLRENPVLWAGSPEVFTPEQFGYTPGRTATGFIQQAVDAAAERGGTVLLSEGTYVSGTLVMRSHVRLLIRAGACLQASDRLEDFPEHHARRLTVQDTSMGMHQSLIFAEDCEGICLEGEGLLDGRGQPCRFPGEETAQGTPGRPFLIRMIDCRDVRVAGLTMKDSPCWMQNYLNCDRPTLEGLTVRNHATYNTDGIDVDGCREVLIRNCRVSSGDDGLCFKGASQRPAERVLVEDCDFYSACNAVKVGTDTQGDFRRFLIRRCRIGGLAEDPSGLKHPCADSGISLEMVDGGTLEDFLLEDLTVTRAWSPFFLRLEDRGRVKPGDPVPGPGWLRRVCLRRICGRGNGPRGSYLMGIPERKIEDLVFDGIHLSQYAWEGPAPDPAAYPDFRGAYPDAHMIDGIGPSPASALWARDTVGLTIRDFRVCTEGEDSRPAFLI